jgi:UDP-N-acetylmuramate--alanine ligase
LVIEADESDGSLTRYEPAIGLLLNISKDHKEVAELEALFREFRKRSRQFVVSADAPGLAEFRTDAKTYGFSAGDLRGRDLIVDGRASHFTADGVPFEVPLPGRYNAENALAAAAVCLALEVPLAVSARALKNFSGVGRRFQVVGSARGVEVVDDFAHNPEKVRAVIGAAQLRGQRVLAVFQLHGFAPARFMKNEFIEAFAESLRPHDALWLPEIYYVGGTAAKDVSAKDYADALSARSIRAFFRPDKLRLAAELAAEAKSGDVVLVLGARDPSLSDLAADILRRVAA